MSGGTKCNCEERRTDIAARAWFVLQRWCNHSAFNGYRYTPSNWSEIQCARCLARWRTKGAFVDRVKNGTPDQVLELNKLLTGGKPC